ncbi:MAG: terpene cyclase/mutase family protein [Planctomycetes bacterium]|nr:terpene cyclase/mutase family protein [Planctomycetota bacterium]
MRKSRWAALAAVTLGSVVFLALGSSAAPEGAKKVGPDQKEWDRLADRAIAYLRSTQGDDGSWSGKQSPGVTGVVLTGLLKTGKLSAKDPMIEKGLKYVESLINPEKGHIAGKDPRLGLQNYVTCVNVMALVSADRDSYKKVVKDATKFLKQLQWDEGEGKNKDSDFYGGAGYDSKSRPDLSNTQFFLDALVEAGIPKDDPALKNALVFVSRCQNLKGEHNDQKWAGKINDGSFIYSAAGGGSTKVTDNPEDGVLPGYGSMTYAGVKSMVYCGVSKDDPRMKKAYEWLRKHYTVAENPGMPKARRHWGLFYYYHTMAKCLDVLGVDYVVDDKNVEHDWRADITRALAEKQQPNGSFTNDQDRWMEGDANIVTGYALMALSYCKPRK